MISETCITSRSAATSTFSTPSSLAAASAAPRQLEPATSTWTGSPSAFAAVSAFAVTSLSPVLSCSATRSVVIEILEGRSEHAGFDLELLHEFGDGGDLDAGLAAAGLDRLQDLEPRRDIDAKRLRRGLGERLLLRLHDVRQRGVARLVEAQIRGHDGGQLQRDGLQAPV